MIIALQKYSRALGIFVYQLTSVVIRYNEHQALLIFDVTRRDTVPFPMVTVKFDFIRNHSVNETAPFSSVLRYEFFYASDIIPWWAKTFRLETIEHAEFTVNQINASAVEAQNISMANLKQMYPLQAKRAWSFGEYNLRATFEIDAKHFIAYPDRNGNVDIISLMQKFTNKRIPSRVQKIRSQDL